MPTHKNIGGDLMESLDLQTGYKGVMEQREVRRAQMETDEFEEEERKIKDEVSRQANLKPDTWLKDSIR